MTGMRPDADALAHAAARVADCLDEALRPWRDAAQESSAFPPEQPAPLAATVTPSADPVVSIPTIPDLASMSAHQRVRSHRALAVAGQAMGHAAIDLRSALGAKSQDGILRISVQAFLHETPAFTLTLPAYGFVRRFASPAGLASACEAMRRALSWGHASEAFLPPRAADLRDETPTWRIVSHRPLLPGLSISIVGSADRPERMLRNALVAAALRCGCAPAAADVEAIAGVGIEQRPDLAPPQATNPETLRRWLLSAITGRTPEA